MRPVVSAVTTPDDDMVPAVPLLLHVPPGWVLDNVQVVPVQKVS